MNVRHQGIALVVTSALILQGCAGEQTTADCAAIADYGARLSCLNDVMFPDVARSAAIGAVTGAVLGGAVAFAITRRPSIGAIGKGVLVGGIVGGVAGGAVAYFRYLQARTGGNRPQMVEYQDADIRDEGRQFRLLAQTSTEMRADFDQQFAAINDRLNSIQSPTSPDLSQVKTQLTHIGNQVTTLGNMLVNSKDTIAVHATVAGQIGSSDPSGNASNAETLRHSEADYHQLTNQLLELERELEAKS